MRVLVDADSCSVKEIILQIAIEHKLDLYMYFDNTHIYEDGYSKVIIVDKSKDSVDLNIINNLKNDDIVVTNDYGLASIAISKNSKAINNNGFIYNENNIDELLFRRFLANKSRKIGIRGKSIKKRTKQMDDNFKKNFLTLIN